MTYFNDFKPPTKKPGFMSETDKKLKKIVGKLHKKLILCRILTLKLLDFNHVINYDDIRN